MRLVSRCRRNSTTRHAFMSALVKALVPSVGAATSSSRAAKAAETTGTSERFSTTGLVRFSKSPYEPLVSRSEEHTSELQSLMRISYAVFCWNKKKRTHYTKHI